MMFCKRRAARLGLVLVFLGGSGVLAADLAAEKAIGITSGEDLVLVARGPTVLRQSDLTAALAIIPREKRSQMAPSAKQGMLFLENVLIYRTLADEAKNLGLDKDPVVAAEARQAADRALALRRLDSLAKAKPMPDFTNFAREQYETKKADFVEPAAVHAAHVLVRAEGRTDDEARARAEEVRQKALKGEDFSELAMAYSDDPSIGKNRGDMGFFGRKQMVKPFEDAAFALSKPGEISPVVKTQFGYHVIRLTELRPERQKSFDEVKESLITQLRDKFITDTKAAYISAIKNDKNIVINEKAIEETFK